MEYDSNDKRDWPLIRRPIYDDRKRRQVLDHCVDKAILTRCIPITIGLTLANHYAIKNGYLRNKGWGGMLRKHLVCITLGTVVGFYSFRNKFTEKMSDFYNREHEIFNYEYMQRQKKMISQKERTSVFDKPHYLNLDTERPDFNGHDPYTHIFNEQQAQSQTEPKKYVTYEELQRKNRDIYAMSLGRYF